MTDLVCAREFVRLTAGSAPAAVEVQLDNLAV
jgi:hypothetical protein